MRPSEGMWWGIVEDIRDPKQRNRIKVKVPDMLGSEISDWADPDSLVISTLKRGDKVWVRFLGGDTRHAVYHIPYDHTGRAILHNATDKTELKSVGQLHLRAPASNAMVSGSTSSVSLNGGSVHCQGKDGAGYVPCRASEFIVSSSAEVKSDIHDVGFDATDIVHMAPAKMWRYIPEHSADGRLRIGPLVENLPAVFTRDGTVDLATLVGILWASVQSLSDRVDELTTEVLGKSG